MTRPLPLLALALLLALSATADAQTMAGVLSPNAATTLDAAIESMGNDGQSAGVSGTVSVRLVLVNHPVHGLVAESIRITGASLSVGDLGWTLSNTFEDFSAAFVGGEIGGSSGVLVATPVAANTSEIAVSGIAFEISGGDFTASGTVLDDDFDRARDFGTGPGPLGLEGIATVVTTPGAGGVTDVRLEIPVNGAVPIDPPHLVAWMRLSGTLVLTGQIAAPAVPAVPHAWWLGVALLVAAAAVLRRRAGGI